MRFNKSLACMLLILALMPTLSHSSDSALSPYSLTLNEAYGKPFSSPGFSGQKDNGIATSASFEYRGWEKFSLGLSYEYLSVMGDPLSLNVNEIALQARILPFGRARMEPYGIVGLGIAMENYTTTYASETSYLAKVGVGVLIKLNEPLSLDLGLNYQSAQNLNFLTLVSGC